jgi:tetratricopeptide (TPR) repeat protein
LSNLDISIKVSLHGHGMRSNPAAKDLLGLLAILPDGIHNNKHLSEIAPDIPQVASAGALLRKVSLAYTDGSRVLRVLAPIRSFIETNYPPKPTHLVDMLEYYKSLAFLSAGIEGGSDGKAIVERLLPEVGNIQAVLEHAFQTDVGNIPSIIQAAINCTDLFRYTGLGSHELLVRSAKQAKQRGLISLKADCIRSQAELHYSRSDKALASQLFEEAMSIYRDLDILPGQGRCTLMLGMAESSSANYQQATAKIELALDLFRKEKNVLGQADCLLRLAQNATWGEDLNTAVPHVQEALKIFKVQSHPRGEARCLWLIGVIAYKRRTDYEAASKMLTDAATLYRQLGDATGEANCFRILGRISIIRGKYGDAAAILKMGVNMYHKVKWVYGEADCCQALGELAMAKRMDEDAISSFEQAQALYRELNHKDGQIFCIRSAGDIAFRRGDWIKAKLQYGQALEMSESEMDKARANLGLAKVLLALGDTVTVHLEESLNELRLLFSKDMNAIAEEGRALEALGDLSQRSSESITAAGYYKSAAEKFRCAQLTAEQADVFVKLGSITSGTWGENSDVMELLSLTQ